MGAFHEAGCWTIWTRCVQNDWWQMPYKYQTWHDWHDDHNGNFPELNGGSKDHIFFLGLTNYTIYIYIMFISFPFWWIQSPWCPPSFGVTGSQVTCSSGLRGSRLASASTGVRGWEDPRSHGMFHLHHNELFRQEGQLPQNSTCYVIVMNVCVCIYI